MSRYRHLFSQLTGPILSSGHLIFTCAVCVVLVLFQINIITYVVMCAVGKSLLSCLMYCNVFITIQLRREARARPDHKLVSCSAVMHSQQPLSPLSSPPPLSISVSLTAEIIIF